MTERVHYNNDLTTSLMQVCDAGWANRSDGSVESVAGAFALITITPNEISELYSAVFNDDHTPEATLQPGNYLFCQSATECLTLGFPTEAWADTAYQIIATAYENAWKQAAIAQDIEAMGRFWSSHPDDSWDDYGHDGLEDES